MLPSFTHNSVRRRALCALVSLSLLGCSDAVDQFNIEIEPTLALLGGTILATQNSGLVAQMPVHPVRPFSIQELFMPIRTAHAASCPAVTHAASECLDDAGVSPGPHLQVFYDNCEAATMEEPGRWRTYMHITFPSSAACLAVKGSGFVGAGMTAITGATVTRKYGSVQENQTNVRLTNVIGPYYEAVYMYSAFDSGWNTDKKGGVEITFNNATTRTINVKGVHAKSIKFEDNPLTSDSFDLSNLGSGVSIAWDHTINTVKTGDTLYTVGPVITTSGGVYGFGSTADVPTATYDGDVVVTNDGISSTVAAGAVFRIQQNVAMGTAVAVVIEPLVYDNANCCWPSSGVIESRFDLSYPSPTTEDRLEFTGESCGAVRYTTIQGESARDTLRHCF